MIQILLTPFASAPHSLLPTLVALLVGLAVGAILNIFIHRVPLNMEREAEEFRAELSGEPLKLQPYNLVAPTSECVHCGHTFGAWEKIPVVSYIVLRGQCGVCAKPIGRRYPAVELGTGLLSALVIWTMGSAAAGLAALLLLYGLVVLTAIDLDSFLLPDDITLPLMWLGLFVNLNAIFVPVAEAVIGAMLGYVLLWGANALYKVLRDGDAIGYGDFKLLAAMGAWMGWSAVPSILVGAIMVAGVTGFSMRLLGRRRDTRLPFGPYLAGAGLLVMLYGQWINAVIE